MNNSNLIKCFVCFLDGKPCGNNQRLSRTKKKLLKKAISLLRCLRSNFEMWEYPSSCTPFSDYKYFLPFIKNMNFYHKYKDVYLKVMLYASDHLEELAFIKQESGYLLAFPWEEDNGLYTVEGSMPLQFGCNPDDGTWAYGETRSICEHFGVNILTTKNERDFIKQIATKD